MYDTNYIIYNALWDNKLPEITIDGGGGMTQIVENNVIGLYVDTDGDCLSDYQEVVIYHTNRLLVDSDNDNWLDGYEITQNTDPNDPIDYPTMNLTTDSSSTMTNNDQHDIGSYPIWIILLIIAGCAYFGVKKKKNIKKS